MHTYRKENDGPWTVGHYQITSDETGPSWQEWRPMKDFDTEARAAAYANFLNGGDGKFPHFEN